MAESSLLENPTESQADIEKLPVRGICLTKPVHDALKDELGPFVEGSGYEPSHLQGKARERRLGEIAKSHLPASVLEELRDATQGDDPIPILFENVPEIPIPDKLSSTAPSTEGSYASALSRGILVAMQHEPTYSDVTVRRAGQIGSTPPAAFPHTDTLHVSMLACQNNDEQAFTRMMDMKTLARAMEPPQREGVVFLNHQHSPPKPITLGQILRDGQMPGMSLTLEEDLCQPKALIQFEALCAKHARDVDLQPSRLLLFRNGKNGVFHNAMKGTRPAGEISHRQITRSLVYEGGNLLA